MARSSGRTGAAPPVWVRWRGQAIVVSKTGAVCLLADMGRPRRTARLRRQPVERRGGRARRCRGRGSFHVPATPRDERVIQSGNSSAMPSGAAGDRIGYWPWSGQITRRKIRRKIRRIAGLRSGKIAGGQIGRVFRITARAGRRHGRRAKRVLISGHLGSFLDQRRHHQTNDPLTLPVPSGFLTAADFATSRPAFGGRLPIRGTSVFAGFFQLR